MYFRTPAPRNAVLLPLIDRLAPLLASLTPKSDRKRRPAPQFLDEISMSMHTAIVGKTFRHVNSQSTENASRDDWKAIPQNLPMDDDDPRDPEKIAAGKRLIATRLALGVTTTRRFAQLMAVPETNLTKWENGKAMVARTFIRKLNEHYGVTYEWIYDGIKRGLPYELALKLVDDEDVTEAP